jgi:hypothetical protein
MRVRGLGSAAAPNGPPFTGVSEPVGADVDRDCTSGGDRPPAGVPCEPSVCDREEGDRKVAGQLEV